MSIHLFDMPMPGAEAATVSDEEWARAALLLDGCFEEPTSSALGDDPPQTLQQMLMRWRTSTTEYVDPRFTAAYFPVRPELFNCDGVFTLHYALAGTRVADVLTHMRAKGDEQVGLEKLLAYGEKWPRAAGGIPIVALGCRTVTVQGYVGYPMFAEASNGFRSLGLLWLYPDESFCEHVRILTVRS